MTDTRSEKAIQNETLVALSALDRSLFYRHNTGQAWQGEKRHAAIGDFVRVEPGMVILARARVINFGLTGSGDIQGAVEGLPVAIEMKSSTGQQRAGQERFEAAWRRAGGVYVLARTVDQAVAMVKSHIVKNRAYSSTKG